MRNRPSKLPPTPLGFKIWFAFCALLGAGMLAFVIWAVIRLLDILEGWR